MVRMDNTLELNCEECRYKSFEESDFVVGYNSRTLCVDCRQKEIKNTFQKCIGEVNEIILIDKKELAKSEECLCYMGLNEYDEHIENNIIEILKFYINDLKDQILQHEVEKSNYEEEIRKE